MKNVDKLLAALMLIREAEQLCSEFEGSHDYLDNIPELADEIKVFIADTIAEHIKESA